MKARDGPFQTAQRSEEWLQDHPALRDERHEEAQDAAQDDRLDLAVLGVHPHEHETLDRQDRGCHHREGRVPDSALAQHMAACWLSCVTNSAAPRKLL